MANRRDHDDHHFNADIRPVVGSNVGMLHWVIDPEVSGFHNRVRSLRKPGPNRQRRLKQTPHKHLDRILCRRDCNRRDWKPRCILQNPLFPPLGTLPTSSAPIPLWKLLPSRRRSAFLPADGRPRPELD
jgi:hypothetical protein